MSSNRSAPPLLLSPVPSPRLRSILNLAHGLALLCVLAVISDWPWAGLLLIPWGYSLRQGLKLVRNNPRLSWDSHGQWWWDSEEEPLVLDGDSYSSPYLVILNLQGHQAPKRRSVVLLSDSLDADSWRRLRVRLELLARV